MSPRPLAEPRPSARSIATTVAAVAALVLATAAVPTAATHSDGSYDQPLIRTHFNNELSVVIVPPGAGQVINSNGPLNGGDLDEVTPCQTSYMRAIRDSIADMSRAIDQFGPAWLSDGLVIDVDSTPPCGDADALDLVRADIIIETDGNKGVILGVAWTVGARCVVTNSRAFTTSFTYVDMYNINLQEYGHCLGLAHVGDGHPSGVDPLDGTYDYTPGSQNPKLCPSNLNVEGLQGVFARALGQDGHGEPGVVPVDQYQQISC